MTIPLKTAENATNPTCSTVMRHGGEGGAREQIRAADANLQTISPPLPPQQTQQCEPEVSVAFHEFERPAFGKPSPPLLLTFATAAHPLPAS